MPDTLNRSELIARLAQAMPAIPAAQVEAAVKTLLDALAESLASGQRIEIAFPPTRGNLKTSQFDWCQIVRGLRQ